MPYPFTYMPVHTHTYFRSPFTTTTQRDSVREVAEADLGHNGERLLRDWLVGVQTVVIQPYSARDPGAHSLWSPG